MPTAIHLINPPQTSSVTCYFLMKYHYLSILSLLISLSILLCSNCQEESEKQILLHLKSALGNPPALFSWNSTSNNHCNWIGVTCIDGFITGINLSNQNISQPIPDSICSLKSLSHVDLSNNNISSTFPRFIYDCSSLQYLNLSLNYFVGTLPNDINKLPPSLTYLSLSGNNFTGEIPPSIGRLMGLKELHLDGNFFNGTYPREIGNLFNLEYLSLAWNSFKPAQIPHEFGNLARLKFLWMTQTETIGEIPITLSNLTDLEHLDLGSNQINGTLPSWIWSLEKLNALYLYDNELEGEINVTGPIRCLGLSDLDLSENKLTGSIPMAFSVLKNLCYLFLYNNFLTGEIPEGIGFLPNLIDIRLFSNNLTGILPENLGNYSRLWNLEIDDNRLFGKLPPHLCSGNNLVSIVVFNNNFTGEIPSSIADCDTLKYIQLHKNRFSGVFPLQIWSITNLNMVMINDNEFTGTLPKALPWNLTRIEMYNNRFTGAIPSIANRLQVFWASNNSFDGELPSDLTGLSGLQELSLGSNQITGLVPQSIKVLKFLNTLNLSNNKLMGPIPSAIGSLTVLTTLDLSNNDISGSIPEEFNNLKTTFLNLSGNKLSGRIPQSLENQEYSRSFLLTELCSDSPYSVLNLPACHSTESSSNKLLRQLIAIFSALTGIGIFGILLLRARTKRNRSGSDQTTWKLTSFQKFDFTARQIIHGLKAENIIGSGGFGEVYKINLKNGCDQIVAVKRIFVGHKINDISEKSFNAEVGILGQIRHANIVKLLCCISSNDSKLLVYEYMENSSLDRWLYGKEKAKGSRALDWPTRLGIAIDAAKGLCYMHHSYTQPIMHRDIKSSNILLDTKFRAKVADFGLARVLEKFGEPETISTIQGSFGYIAPECGRKRKINEKVDVFSFGVVLLELITGKRANEGDEYETLSDWALRLFQEHNSLLVDMIDQDIRNDEYLHDIVAVFELGLVCTMKDPIARPTMKMVLQRLTECDRTNNACINFGYDLCDEAPLFVSKKGGSSEDFYYAFDEHHEDTSGDFVVRVS